MYQETISPNGGRLRDALSVLSLLVAVIVVEIIGSHAGNDIPWLVGAAHLVAFLALVIFCYCFYRFRLTGVRYSLRTDENDEADDDDTEPKPELPPVGTFAAERMMGDVGSLIEIIAPEELVALVGYSKTDERIAALKHRERATRLPKKTASVLIYKRNGRECGLIMHPSDELRDKLRVIIENNAKS